MNSISTTFSSESVGAQAAPYSLRELLRRRAIEQGNQIAYTYLVDGEAEEISLTFKELEHRARAIGAGLQSMGARGERVLLLYPSGLDYVAAFFGCLYAGAIAVPAYPPRRNRLLTRLQAIVADAQASFAVTTQAMLPKMESLFVQTPGLDALRWMTTDDLALGLAEGWQEPETKQNTLAFIQYTSGSTSIPKGVMVSHGNLLHNEEMIRVAFQQTENSIIVGWLPIYHDMGLIGNVLHPMYVGSRCILMSPVSFLQSPLRWLQAISRYRATTSGGPNFAYELCVRKITPEQRALLDLSSWKVAFNGAEPVKAETLRNFAMAFEPSGFSGKAFYPCYGLAEATLLVSGSKKHSAPVIMPVQSRALENNLIVPCAEEEAVKQIVGCGVAPQTQTTVIVNPSTMRECLPEEVGEIWVAGPSVAQGYWNRPAETEQTFRARLAGMGGVDFLRTGDLGFLRDGELFVTGRVKDLIIIRGRNLYPQDIELTVERCHASLRAGAGAAFSTEVDGEERLVIAQEIDYRTATDTEAVIDAIRQAVVEEYEVQPYAIGLLRAGSIPKTSSGKIQRHACRAAWLNNSLAVVASWQGVIADEGVLSDGGPEISFDSPEEFADWLRSLLAAKLGVEATSIDIDEPVTRYGLDSLIAVELAHHVETRTGLSLPPAGLLQGDSLAHLAIQLYGETGSTAYPAKLLSRSAEEAKEEEYPLSFNQQSLWFLHELAPQSPVYHIARAARIVGPLNVAALRRAYQSLVDRHPSLRTTFIARSGKPFQRIASKTEICFQEQDASAWSETRLSERLIEEAEQPFDLEEGPLLRLSIFRRTKQEHILLLTVHHLIADFWSLAMLLRETTALYRMETEGVEANLPPLTWQYADHVQWQEQALSGPQGERVRSYWQTKLSGELPVTTLPADHPRPSIQTYRGAVNALRLDAELTGQLKELAHARQVTLYMTLLAAFQVLLSRYSGQTDILVGSPAAGRTRSETAEQVGYFVNPLVMRGDLSGNPTFEDYLAQVRKTVLDAFEHQDYPFALLVEQLHPVRDPSRTPLFNVMFALQKTPAHKEEDISGFALGEEGSHLQLGELDFASYALERRVAQFDLSLLVAEQGAELATVFEYNTDLFDAATIERLAQHWRRLLEEIVARPCEQVLTLPLLSEAEQWQLRQQWNETRRSFPDTSCIHQLFEQQVERTPEAVALISDEQAVSYAELNEKANRLAHHLRARGVGPEALVGVAVERSAEMLTALLGILKAGGAYVPLDPAYPAERLRLMMADSGLKTLVTQQSVSEKFLPADGLLVVDMDADWESISLEKAENPTSGVISQNTSFVIYTSGSTGIPKGVKIPHRAVLNCLHSVGRQLEVTARDVVLANTTLSFDIATVELYLPLITGARMVIANRETVVDGARLADLIEKAGVTFMQGTPATYRLLLGAGWAGSKRLRATCAGEALARELANQVLERTAEFWNLYGPTETTIYSTSGRVEAGAGSVSIGRPIDNTQIYLLDPAMQLTPIGVAGELYIGGEGVTNGYLQRPALTAERFIPDPFSTAAGKRLYKTGDLARYLSDGTIEFLGRLDAQVKIRGFRIELGEIESVLRRHSAVREAIVAVRRETGDDRLVAYLVLEPGQKAGASELRRFLQAHLPEYMLPASFVFLSRLPLTPSGKVDRRALPEPEHLRPELESIYAMPQTAVEEMIAGVWAEVLGIEKVGIHDNFFELGGHSLLAMQIISRLGETLGTSIPLRNLFERPTVARLAESIETSLKDESERLFVPILPTPLEGDAPLSFSQQRLWFLGQLDPHSPAYNVPAAVRLTGRLDRAALAQSINEIVRRHEVFRTTFSLKQGEPVQVITPVLNVELPVIDIDAMDDAASRAEAERLITEKARQPFDLVGGPLLRVLLLSLRPEEHVFLIVTHHIISDYWSMAIFIRELTALYEAFALERPSPLPELPVQYRDYAHWQRAWLNDEALEGQLNYWKRQLADPPVLDLPIDRARPLVQSFRGASLPVVIPSSLTASLKALSQHEGATLFMTLLAAFNVLLYRYTGQDDIIVGSPVTNRSRPEIEGLFGLFVNTLALRVNLSGAPSFRQLLVRVRELCLGAYAHQDLPFERIVEALQPERDLSRNPLFQVAFGLQNVSLPTLSLGDMTLTPLEVDRGAAIFDLTLSLNQGVDGLSGTLQYNNDLFDRETVERMAAHFLNLLKSVVASPDARVWELSLLDSDERRRLLVGWNATQRDYGAPVSLHSLFEKEAACTPDAVAVSFEGQRLSYEELNRRANRLAHYLRRLGVGPEARVTMCLERSPEMVIALLAVLKAGGAYVPLDPDYPSQRLRFMLEDSQSEILLTEGRWRGLFPDYAGTIIELDADSHLWAEQESENPNVRVEPENLAYIIYTSGSTGTPKGGMNSHAAIVNRLLWMQEAYHLSGSDKVLQKTPFSFDVSVWEFFWPLITGAQLVLARPGGHRDSAYLRDLIADERITTLHFVPSMLQVFLQEPEVEKCISLQRVIVSGEALSVDLQERFFSRLPAELHNLYGPTEAAVDVTSWACQPEPQARTVPIGKPIANLRIYICDEHLQPAPIGVAGQLYIGGAGLGRGYVGRPMQTADKWVPNPFEEGQRLYATGDLARYRPDGAIEFLGRIDHQVKMRGFRIELGEIEHALNSHPAIEESVVIVREDVAGDKRLVAYGVPNRENAHTMREFARMQQMGRLNGYVQCELPNRLTVMGLNRREVEFVYQEIWEEEGYLKHGVTIEDGDCVFDVGANIGLFSLFAAERGKQVKIYAFEPLPPIFELLRINASLHELDAVLLNYGLSGRSTIETFTYYPKVSILSGRFANLADEKEVVRSFLLNDDARFENNEDVELLLNDRLESLAFSCPIKTISEIIREHSIEKIDLLKIDAEKSELDILSGIEETHWPLIKQAVIEVHGSERLHTILSLLKERGFETTAEQDSMLKDTALYNVYAVRTSFARTPRPVKQRENTWSSVLTLATELREGLKDKLPEYMVPASIVFLESLPLLPNGKINRHALPAPERAVVQAGQAFEPPQSSTEKIVAQMWEEVLSVKEVGVNQNFFELGGHSLMIAQLVSRIRNAFGVELPLQIFFTSPTIKELVTVIEDASLSLTNAGDIDDMLDFLEELDESEAQAILHDSESGKS